MTRRALFVDRDGTLVHARHYPRHPEELVLYDGIAEVLAELKEAGFVLVMITNQSGIARGLFTPEALQRMHDALRTELAAAGAGLDAIYVCPHHPDGRVAGYAVACDCRKPRPGMVLQAARDLDLDLGRSWFVGDILDDVEAGNRAGCRTVLVDLATESPPLDPIRMPAFVARNAVHALRIVQCVDDHGPRTDLSYRPAAWIEPNGRSAAISQRRALSGVAAGGERG